MTCLEYGFTVVEMFAHLLRTEADPKLNFSLGSYKEQRLKVDEEDVWRFDMKAAEEVMEVFLPYISRDRQLEILSSLMPSIDHCVEVHRMLKG